MLCAGGAAGIGISAGDVMLYAEVVEPTPDGKTPYGAAKGAPGGPDGPV